MPQTLLNNAVLFIFKKNFFFLQKLEPCQSQLALQRTDAQAAPSASYVWLGQSQGPFANKVKSNSIRCRKRRGQPVSPRPLILTSPVPTTMEHPASDFESPACCCVALGRSFPTLSPRNLGLQRHCGAQGEMTDFRHKQYLNLHK